MTDESTQPSAADGPRSRKRVLPSAKKKYYSFSLLSSVFSVSTLSTCAAAFYVYFALSNLVNLMYPLRTIPQDVLEGTPDNRLVRPFWSKDGSSSGGEGELGLRVYLSSEREFSLDFFLKNDDFGTTDEEDEKEEDGGIKTIKDGNSFLLWSEDNALDATQTFPSRSFVIVASDDPSASAGSCSADGGETCSEEDQQAQTSLQFAHKWLEDSIQHEKQLQSDGGGLMAAMNSAGGGIESTSVLLTFYTSVRRNLKHLVENVNRFGTLQYTRNLASHVVQFISGGKKDSDGTSQSTSEKVDEEEPKSIVHISPQNPLWKALMSNGTAYVHVLLVRQTPISSDQPPLLSASPDARAAAARLQQLHSHHNVLFGAVGMMKRELPLHVPSPKRLLYRDVLFALKKYVTCPTVGLCDDAVAPWNVGYHQPQEQEEYQTARRHKREGTKYPYWKPEVMIHLIQDDQGYPLDYHNRIGFDIVQVRGNKQHSSGYAYLPAVHVDEIGLTSDKYIPLNETVSALPLRIGFHSGLLNPVHEGDEALAPQQGLTPARYRLLNHLSSALESQREMGFEQSDIDDLRRLIAETNVLLLAITVLASVFHLLFEFLTFKSDVDFWRGNTDLTGLSVRALFLDWLSQVVILFYLIEMDSSLLMTVPTGVGMLIALWKCQRGAGLKFVKTGTGLLGYQLRATRLRAAASSSDEPADKKDLAALTEEMDQLATRLLGKYFLLPLVVCYAVYSLVKEPHSGWYSWFITTASSFVYAVGFVLMTPQLFLNYKLKSVAHLPWRVLGYRFVNTFIDDLFAFIIRMPTMARMSCFRDDVVFIIYLWQRHLYPVDSSRPVEGGAVGDVVIATIVHEEGGKKSKKKKQS